MQLIMTSSNSQMHNDIMTAGTNERPPMLAPISYAQWKSRFMRCVGTKHNRELLMKTIYEKALIDAEAEAVHMILKGIGNDTYYIVDACLSAKEMWIGIERLQQRESIYIQDIKTKLLWEFGKFTLRDGESIESYYIRFYRMMNEMVRNKLIVGTMQVNVQFLQQLQQEWYGYSTKRTKIKQRRTKPGTGSERARKNEAEGVFEFNGSTRTSRWIVIEGSGLKMGERPEDLEDPLERGERCKRCTCKWCGSGLSKGFCFIYASNNENSSINDPQNDFTHPLQSQYETYICELCGNDSHYGYDYPPRFPLVYEQEPCYNQNYDDNYYSHNPPSFLCYESCGGPHESFQCQPMNQNHFEHSSNYSSFDQIQPPQYYVMHQPPEESVKEFEKQLKTIVISALEGHAFREKQHQPEDIQELLHKLLNDLQIINEELADYINSPSCNYPSSYEDDEYTIQYSEYLRNSSTIITPDLPTKEPDNSLSTGDEHLSTIPETESDELIKSSVEDLVPIPSESEGISDDTCDVPFCDNSPPLDVLNDHFEIFSDFNDDCTLSNDDSFKDIDYVEASPPDSELVSLEELLSNEDVPKDVKIYSNLLFEFDNEYISSDVNPLFNEVLEDIECKDSYDSNLDESTFLVTPLSNSNEDECLAPSDDIELLLYHDSSISVVSILEGFTDEPPLEKNDDLFDLESKTNDWKNILYDASIDDLIFDPGDNIDEIDTFLDVDISTNIEDGYHDSEGDILYLESLLSDNTTLILHPKVFLDHDPRSLSDSNDLKIMVKVFDPGIHEQNFSPTYVSLPFEDRHYLSFTYVILTFLPYFTYPMEYFLLSSGSEDTIFDPGISAFHFSSLEPVAYEFPIKDCPDFEDSRAHGFVPRPLDLQSFACLFLGIRYPRSY
ncbi:hypothetical protein Tco_1262439 [Tanacetum coccineum]